MSHQKWARNEMLRDLQIAQEELEANELMELRYTATQNSLVFWLQRKRKKSLEERVQDDIRLWTSGLVFNLVDFAIALQEMRNYLSEPKAEPNACLKTSSSASSDMQRPI